MYQGISSEDRANFGRYQSMFANIKKIHYILLIDDSGEKQEESIWMKIKQEAVKFLEKISKNLCARVTIITFNSLAQCVADFEPPDPSSQEEKILFKGGSTDLDEALLLAYDQIIKQPNFGDCASHKIYLYTDSDAAYPNKALKMFEQLTKEQKEKIELVVELVDCTERYASPSLDSLITFLSQEFSHAELRKSNQTQ